MHAAMRGGSVSHVLKRPANAIGASHGKFARGKARWSANAHGKARAVARIVCEVTMFRWLGLAVVVVAIVLAACGRQVTGLNAPNAGSITSGDMLIRFRVAGPLDFTNVQYLVVFNTTGNRVEPYPQANLTGYLNYSFAFVVGGNQYTSQPLLYQYYLAPGTTSGIQLFRITIPPQLINYVPNSGGNPSGGGEFTITFSRSLLYGVNPGGTPTPTATKTPTPTPTPTGSSAPVATVTLNPNVQPTTAAQETWAINFITTDTNGVPIDSMGIGGPTDTTFSYTVDTTQAVDNTITKATGTSTVQNLSAQLQGFEVINAP
jgi:hypothetical protein